MYYSRSYRKMILGTSNGILARLFLEAELLDEELDEDEGEGEKEKKVIEQHLDFLGRFHTKTVRGIRELAGST